MRAKKHKNVSNNVYKNVFLNIIISDKVCTRLPGLCHTVTSTVHVTLLHFISKFRIFLFGPEIIVNVQFGMKNVS